MKAVFIATAVMITSTVSYAQVTAEIEVTFPDRVVKTFRFGSSEKMSELPLISKNFRCNVWFPAEKDLFVGVECYSKDKPRKQFYDVRPLCGETSQPVMLVVTDFVGAKTSEYKILIKSCR